MGDKRHMQQRAGFINVFRPPLLINRTNALSSLATQRNVHAVTCNAVSSYASGSGC